jgi:hypothetical protein
MKLPEKKIETSPAQNHPIVGMQKKTASVTIYIEPQQC